jgi:hypothetical protein
VTSTRGLPERFAEELGLAKNGHRKPSSPSPHKGQGRRDDGPELVRLAEVEAPGPRRYLLEELVLASYPTLLYGDGGVAKSLLALALAVAVAGNAEEWLGCRVENGPVLYVDFELDAEEQARRVRQLCRIAGRDQEPPENLLYMGAVGHSARDVFSAARKACEEHGVVMVILDSYGVALGGDAEASKDVIAFNNEVLEPFRKDRVAVLIIDHQSKLQAGQSYQSKGAFGSVFKSNLARSVIQVEATERGENTLTVRLRQKKHNFGPLADPFAVRISFSEESVDLAPVELEAAEKAEEATLNAADRVRLALKGEPLYPWEIAETTGLAVKTVKNALTDLRKRGVVEPTGETEDRAQRVRLIVPVSLPYKGDEDGDDKPDDLQKLLAHSPEWLSRQLDQLLLEPDRMFDPTLNAIGATLEDAQEAEIKRALELYLAEREGEWRT